MDDKEKEKAKTPPQDARPKPNKGQALKKNLKLKPNEGIITERKQL